MTSLTMSLFEEDAMLKLCLEEGGVMTTCDIPLLFLDSDSLQSGLTFNFKSGREVGSVIFKSEVLREELLEVIDVLGASTVKIQLSKDDQRCFLSSQGIHGSCVLDIPKASSALISFDCSVSCEWRYAINPITLSLRPLAIASESCLRVNAEGILCLQHQVSLAEGTQSSFIDFLLLPDVILDHESQSD